MLLLIQFTGDADGDGDGGKKKKKKKGNRNPLVISYNMSGIQMVGAHTGAVGEGGDEWAMD